MKDINQISQLLKSILEIPWQPTSIRTDQGFMVGILADDKDLIFEHIQQTLALLSCETCEQIRELKGIIMDIEDRATINFDDKLLLFIKELKDGKSRRNLLYG